MRREVDFRVIKIKSRASESLDQMLKRFKKICEKEGLTREIKRTAFYEKPSEIKRRKERQLVRKMQKEALYNKDFRM